MYICMDLIEGKSLLSKVPPGGMSEAEAKGYFYQICLGVTYCHSKNVKFPPITSF